MSIRITGRMRVEGPRGAVEGQDLPGRQGRLVLASLALADRAVTREVLAERLWGGRPTRAWERDLSALVSKLRGVLAEVGLDDVATIASDGASYQLETVPALVDVRRARAAAAGIDDAIGRGEVGAAGAAADDVLEVTGRPLLAGEDADWIDDAREELGRLRVRALEASARVELVEGRPDAARDHLRQALEVEPFRETTHRLLMEAELAAGNRGEAVRAYERLRRTLADELGVDPAPETEALYVEALRTQAIPGPRRPLDPPRSAGEATPRRPEIRYARSGRVSIAYQVVGSGPVDLVVVPGWVSNLELAWHEPRMASFLARLADECRLILFDKRGTGLSDPVPLDEPPPLEVRMDDVRAVMDAAESERAVILGFSEGGTMSLLFAASHPERTAGLALWGTWCRQLRGDDFPLGWTREEGLRRFVRPIQRTGAPPMQWFAPSMIGDPDFEAWFDRYARQSASPGMAIALLRANAPMDLRSVLPTIRVPTLVLHREGDVLVEVGQGRYLAEHIPGARIAEFPGRDHWPWIGDAEPVLRELLGFARSCRDGDAAATSETILTTVVVATLPTPLEAGPVATAVEEANGVLVRTDEDTVVARFDGPGRAVAFAQQLVLQTASGGRAAVHTGPATVSADAPLTGTAPDLAGEALEHARPGEVVVTRTVVDLVPASGFDITPRGTIEHPDLLTPLPLFLLG